MGCFPYVSIPWTNISGKKKSMIWEGNLAKGLAELHFLLNHFSFSYFISCISKKGRELCSAFCYYIKHMGLEVCALIEREVASCLLSVGDKGAFSLCVSFWMNPWTLVFIRRVGVVGGEKHFSGVECILYTDQWSHERTGRIALAIFGMKGNSGLFRQLELIFGEEGLAWLLFSWRKTWGGKAWTKPSMHTLFTRYEDWRRIVISTCLWLLISSPVHMRKCSGGTEWLVSHWYVVRICGGTVSHWKASHILWTIYSAL